MSGKTWLRIFSATLGIPTLRHYTQDAADKELRFNWCKLLFRAGHRLNYPQEATATAIILFHRWLIREPLQPHIPQRDLVLTTCLFLAGKVEEVPRRLRDVINVVHRLTAVDKNALPPLDQAYWDMKGKMVECEQVVLRTIAFGTEAPHPYRLLLAYSDAMGLDRATKLLAWGMLNDFLFVPAALTLRPQVLACAAIHMAMEVQAGAANGAKAADKDEPGAGQEGAAMKVESQTREGSAHVLPGHWWKEFDVEEKALKQACHCLLDLYQDEAFQKVDHR
ncbi:unnamed protein product [Chrysoparadoxa australica]